VDIGMPFSQIIKARWVKLSGALAGPAVAPLQRVAYYCDSGGGDNL
jgi:hypothetical protein